MRKRLQFARTLVCDPPALLCDEPFGALDAQTKIIMQELLLRLTAGRAMVFVTHDLREAVTLGDRVVIMGARPGRIVHVEQIDPELKEGDLVAAQSSAQFTYHYDKLWAVLSELVPEFGALGTAGTERSAAR